MSYGMRFFPCPACHAPDLSYDGQVLCDKCKMDYRQCTVYIDQLIWAKEMINDEQSKISNDRQRNNF